MVAAGRTAVAVAGAVVADEVVALGAWLTALGAAGALTDKSEPASTSTVLAGSEASL